MNDIPLPEKGIKYTDRQGETFEVIGRGDTVGLTYWYKLRNMRTGQVTEATYSQIKQAVTDCVSNPN